MEQEKLGTVLSEENVPKIIIKLKYYSIYGISTVIVCICARKGFLEIGTGGNDYG